MGGKRINWKKLTPEIIRFKKEGFNCADIAYKLKISNVSVAKKLKELGVDAK
jgi:Mn-dependent DtxR family transcriptional regulator